MWGAMKTLPHTAVLITDGNSLVWATKENMCMPSFLVVELLGRCTGEKHVCVYQGASLGKDSTCNAEDPGDGGSIPGLGRSYGGRNWQPTSVVLPENSY